MPLVRPMTEEELAEEARELEQARQEVAELKGFATYEDYEASLPTPAAKLASEEEAIAKLEAIADEEKLATAAPLARPWTRAIPRHIPRMGAISRENGLGRREKNVRNHHHCLRVTQMPAGNRERAGRTPFGLR